MNAPPPELPKGLVFRQGFSSFGPFWIREVRNADGQLHNPTGPASEHFCAKTGRLKSRRFFLNHKLHNPHGPAVLQYINENEVFQQFWLNDTLVDTEEEFLALTLATKKSAGKK